MNPIPENEDAEGMLGILKERGKWTSASASERDLLCPGSHLACVGLPEVTSDEAMSGTFIHAYLAGQALTPLSADEQEIADACRRRADRIIEEWALGKHYDTYTEERMWCAVSHKETYKHSGQADLICLQGQRAAVLDFKTGRTEVPEPNSNQQLRDLAVLASIRWPVTEVTVAIVQPFAPAQPPCVYDDDDLKRAYKEMRQRVRMSNNPLAPRIAGDKQCRFCRYKSQCPEYRAWIEEALPAIRESLLPTMPWTPQQWAQFLAIAPEAEKWIKERKEEAKLMLLNDPNSIPGYALENGERDKVTNPQGVFDMALGYGVTQTDFMQAVNITKKGLKTALRTVGLKGMKLDQAMDCCLAGNVETTPIEPTIVRKEKP